MAIQLTPIEIAEKQIKAASQHVQDYRDGVRKTTKNPMERAKRSKDKMISNFQQAMSDGSYEEGLDSITLEEWREITAGKGGDNYVRGVQAAKNKIIAFQEQFTPFRRQVQQGVDQMPNDTLEQRMERMTANAMGLHQFRFRRRNRRTV